MQYYNYNNNNLKNLPQSKTGEQLVNYKKLYI